MDGERRGVHSAQRDKRSQVPIAAKPGVQPEFGVVIFSSLCVLSSFISVTFAAAISSTK